MLHKYHKWMKWLKEVRKRWHVFTWSLAGSKLPEAAAVVCLLRPLGPEPQPHLPPKQTNTYCFFLINRITHFVRKYTK